MNDEDVSKTDSLIESFVDTWIVSGKSEATVRKYARYLWNICEGFDRGIDELASDKEGTLAQFDEYVKGTVRSLKSYMSAFRAYCEFQNNGQGAVMKSSHRKLLTIPSSSGATWYQELVVDDIEKWKPLLGEQGSSIAGGSWIFRGQGYDKWGADDR